MKIRWGRKFLFALFCAALVVYCLVVFTIHIGEPQAGLLLSLIAAPALGIIAVVVGVEGGKDIKLAGRSGEGR